MCEYRTSSQTLCAFLRCRSLVVDVKGQSVTCDLHHIGSQVEVAKHVPHGGSVRVHVVIRPRIVLLEVQDEGHELTEAPLVEHPHQIWRKTLIPITLKPEILLRY